jgi:hypothetical protein
MITRNLTLSKVDKGFNQQRSPIFSGTSTYETAESTRQSAVILNAGDEFVLSTQEFISMISTKPVSVEGTKLSLLVLDGAHNSITVTGLYKDTMLELTYGND